MAAPPLHQPQAPAFLGRRSTGAKSRAFLASLAAAPDEAQQHQQQGGASAAEQQAVAYEWQRVPIAASALASIDHINFESSAQQQQQQHGDDATLPAPQPAHSAGGLHHHAASLDTRTLEQVERLAGRHSTGDTQQPRRPHGSGTSAHAKVMMWDMSALDPDGAPLPPPLISARGTPTSQPQTPMGDPDAGLPPVIETKHEAALTGLSAGAGVKLSDFRRHARLSADTINALEPRKERRMNAEERTLRWLDQLEVPAVPEVELRRNASAAGGSSSARAHAGSVGAKPAKPAVAQAAAPNTAMSRRERPPQQLQQPQQQQQERQPPQRPLAGKPQKRSLLSCLSCTMATD